jgi:hypothetical protein
MYLIENLGRQIASEVSWASEGGATLRLVLRP